jgi:hypothetical protein
VTIAAAAADLRAMARAADDASGYFPAMYARVTDAIAAAVKNKNFEDGARMDALATTFAGYYLRAARREGNVPRCWQATWDVATDPKLLIVQHLLLGINAHVNHDLPQAVVDVADEAGELAPIRNDFDAVNDVLAMTDATVISDLDRVSRWTNQVATLGGGRVFNFSLQVARARAWDAAERLYSLDGDARSNYIADLDEVVSVVAYLVTRPPALATPLLRLARRLEQSNPRRVIDALLGEA